MHPRRLHDLRLGQPGAANTWSRIFDFGTGTTVNMFLTVTPAPARGSRSPPAAAARTSSASTAPRPLPHRWTHVAVTLSGTTGTLYVNGAPVGTNPNMTLRPSSIGDTTHNWIGRSQYGDPILNATVDDFNIYGRALARRRDQGLADGAGRRQRRLVPLRRGRRRRPRSDSSGNGRDATDEHPDLRRLRQGLQAAQRGARRALPWKDQQNFAPFIERVARPMI